MDDLIDEYEEKSFERQFIVELMEQGLRSHYISGLIEVDVTKGRHLIKEYEENSGKELSFTAWITKCIAQAISEHRNVHAIRKGKRLIIFKDVDVSVMIERQIDRELGPYTYIVRKANEKTAHEIQDEIWGVQSRMDGIISETMDRKMMQRLFALPKFLRDFLLWRKFRTDPFFVKKQLGTVTVTAVGMFGKGKSGWAIPISISPVLFALGGIAKKPAVVDEKIEIREYLCVTIFMNHDVVDGGPAARFVARFAELVESEFGLDLL
ncbi:MAG: 2-oxo acid dehydrogenase subunit E2 [Candidatus Thorarchaeota archaeon]